MEDVQLDTDLHFFSPSDGLSYFSDKSQLKVAKQYVIEDSFSYSDINRPCEEQKAGA